MQYLNIAGNRVCDDTQRPRDSYPGGPTIRVEIYKSWEQTISWLNSSARGSTRSPGPPIHFSNLPVERHTNN